MFGIPFATQAREVLYASFQSFVKALTRGPRKLLSFRIANRHGLHRFAPFDSRDAGHADGNLRRGLRRRLCLHRSAALACLYAASLPGPRLHLDSGLLGLGPRGRLLLGSWHLGARPDRGLPLDSGLLGLVEWRV